MDEFFSPGDPDRWPVVPYVPFRCPHCLRPKPYTANVRGRLRLHRCQGCGCRFRSIELKPDEMEGWKSPPMPA